MVMISGAFKLIEKVLHVIFLEFLNSMLIKHIYVVVFSLYFILIAVCPPLGEYIIVYSSILLPTDIWGFPRFLIVYTVPP